MFIPNGLKLIFILLFATFIAACTGSGLRKDTAQLSPAFLADNDSFLISPIYSDTVFFIVNSVSGDRVSVTGDTTVFKNSSQTNYETYFQRFAEKHNGFRIIHAKGSGLEVKEDRQGRHIRDYSFNDTISFDEKGIFKNDTTDPVSLIPLYPDHRVKRSEEWKPKVPVKISFGSGTANYIFKIDSVYKDANGAQLALVKVEVTASLQPVPALMSGKVSVSGGGWFVWDCTVNQRRETHLRVTYTGQKEATTIREVVTTDDELKMCEGKQSF